MQTHLTIREISDKYHMEKRSVKEFIERNEVEHKFIGEVMFIDEYSFVQHKRRAKKETDSFGEWLPQYQAIALLGRSQQHLGRLCKVNKIIRKDGLYSKSSILAYLDGRKAVK